MIKGFKGLKRSLRRAVYAGLVCFSIGAYSQETLPNEESESSSLEDWALRRENAYTEVVEPIEESESIQEARQKITSEKIFDLLALYEGRDGTFVGRKVGFLPLFMSNLEKEIWDDPFYYSYVPLRTDKLPYREKFWTALWRTGRKKYKVIEETDRTLKRAQNYITVSYTLLGTKIRVRPLVDDIEDLTSWRALVLLGNYGKMKVGKDSFDFSVGEDINKVGNRLYLDFSCKRREEDSERGDGREAEKNEVRAFLTFEKVKW